MFQQSKRDAELSDGLKHINDATREGEVAVAHTRRGIGSAARAGKIGGEHFEIQVSLQFETLAHALEAKNSKLHDTARGRIAGGIRRLLNPWPEEARRQGEIATHAILAAIANRSRSAETKL